MENIHDVHVLSEEIKLSDLLGDGAEFSFESDPTEEVPSDYYENLFFDTATDEQPPENSLEQGAPGQLSFKEIALKMESIDEEGWIKKLLTKPGYGESITQGALVEIHYNAFWEGENISFDSTYLRGETKQFTIGEGEVLPGIETATRSMLQGEHAQFLIDHNLLFGERGCQPRIKPESTGLFNIEVVRVIASNKVTVAHKEEQEEAPFQKVLDCAKSLKLSGKDAVNKYNLHAAIKYFLKAVDVLEKARLSCEEEQIEQQSLLTILYTNLAVCFNKQSKPKRACTMCNELSRITDINKHCKGLYQNALALQALGEYKRAKVLFNKAYKLQPDNAQIGKRLADLQILIENQVSYEREMCGRIFNMQQEEKKETNVEEVGKEFQDEVLSMIKEFDRGDAKELSLPPLLRSSELQFITDSLTACENDIILQKSAQKHRLIKK